MYLAISRTQTSGLNGQSGSVASANGGRATFLQLANIVIKVQKMSPFCYAEIFLIMNKVKSQQEWQIMGYF